MEISRTDIQKIVSYLSGAERLYDALPMQSMKCRAHMIRQLVNKLNKQTNGKNDKEEVRNSRMEIYGRGRKKDA